MNAAVNTYLLPGEKIMAEMFLRQPGFRYNTFRPFTKSKEWMQKFKETGEPRYVLQNELDKACIQHDMTFANFNDLPRSVASGRALRD